MPWDPSNQNGQDQDPWGRKKKSQGPPDLDALLKQYKDKLVTAIGGKKGGGSSKNGSNGSGDRLLIGLIAVVVLVLWALFGIYIVSPSERAVVLRFGKYVDTVGSGPHWIPRMIESKEILNVETVMQYPYQSEMLTKDENIISAEITVFYRIDNPENYLFNVVDPISTLEQATASALRQVVGHSTLDELLTTGREKVREDVLKGLQDVLNSYKAGLLVTDVNLQPFNPPQPVMAAFDDAIKAREDEQSYVNQATAYANRITADARGRSARILEEADAFKQQVVLQAQAEIAGYLALLPEYRKSPGVMRERLYLGTLESVFANTSKIFLDENGGNPMLYLPLDKMSNFSNQPSASKTTQVTTPAATTQSSMPNINPGILSSMLNRTNTSTTTRGSR